MRSAMYKNDRRFISCTLLLLIQYLIPWIIHLPRSFLPFIHWYQSARNPYFSTKNSLTKWGGATLTKQGFSADLGVGSMSYYTREYMSCKLYLFKNPKKEDDTVYLSCIDISNAQSYFIPEDWAFLLSTHVALSIHLFPVYISLQNPASACNLTKELL